MNEEGIFFVLLVIGILIYAFGSELICRIREIDHEINYLKCQIDYIYNVVTWIYQMVDKDSEDENEE